MNPNKRVDNNRRDRQRAKKARQRKPHQDKYEHRRMDTALRRLAEHFNGAETDRDN